MAPRRVVITGTTRGLGAAMARHYLEVGDEVIGLGRTEPAIAHHRYTHCCVDVTEHGEVEQFFGDLHARVDHLDVLINNAGLASMNALMLTPVETARRVLDTNVLATFTFTRCAARLMRNSGHGRVVNITSVAVPLRLEGEAVYAATKGAVEIFTRIAARELGAFGITCNAIGPSPIRTTVVEEAPDRKLEALVQTQAVRRWAEPADVFNVVDFLLRPESSMVTGQIIYLGGAG